MEFLKRLEEIADSKMFGKQLSNIPLMSELNHYRVLKGLVFGEDIVLSIQASYGHYCTPRETIELDDYSEMELGLIQNGGFVTVTNLLPEFKRLKEIEEYESTVYGYVPVDLIEELYQELKKSYRLVK
ncbi:hypothetical protein [Bacillus toyonensis]|uniref:hypothetical protein n=1 Tax=Bacillus toyonensis TaxID=155322 RepID=UPI000BFB8101|nr:hypothetical protein [Bacillus toyonensis]PHD96638.1 hypothetical protein COF43_22545 [Bacillus toyonensis]